MKYIEIKKDKLGRQIRKLYIKENGEMKFVKFLSEKELVTIKFEEEHKIIES